MTTLITAILAFAATNIDDIFILMVWFAQVGPGRERRHIIIGQFLGFSFLLLLSLLGYLGALIIPRTWLGLFGIVPILMGIRQLLQLRHTETKVGLETPATHDTDSEPRTFAAFLHPQTYRVAAVTAANGADNISVYVPLLAGSSLPRLLLIAAVFFILVGVWCYTGLQLSRHPATARTIARYGHILVPFILIGLGIYILMQNGSLSLLRGRLW